MARSLIDKYTYGVSKWPAPLTPEAEILYENPRRQNEMINLARQQIDVQKEAARAVVQSNIAGAQIISAEIYQQTQILESVIDRMSNKLADGIAIAADQITNSIDVLGDRLCAELSEIKWQLCQQNDSLEKILDLLRNSRNVEAQQLVRQGVRHYVNKEYEEAEERFKKALGFDTTDYQVLMNLGYIEIHKDNDTVAFTYFNKASTLPENLDQESSFRTIWAIARLHYATGKFEKAYNYAQKALATTTQGAQEADNILTSATYAALAGKEEDALQKLIKAIQVNPSTFALAATHPDLEQIRPSVLHKLGELSYRVNEDAISKYKICNDLLNKVKHSNYCNHYDSTLNLIDKKFDAIKRSMSAPSYSDSIKTIQTCDILLKLLNMLLALDKIIDGHKKTNDSLTIKQSELNQANNQRSIANSQNKVSKENIEQIRTVVKVIGGVIALLWCIYICYSGVQEGNRTGNRGGVALMLLASPIWGSIVVAIGAFLGSVLGKLLISESMGIQSTDNISASVSSLETEIRAMQRQVSTYENDLKNNRERVKKLEDVLDRK